MPVPYQRMPRVKPVDYLRSRDLIKTGDILLCSGNSLISEMIKRATKGIWSHVAFIIKLPELDRLMVLESVESIGVRTVPLSCYINGYGGKTKGYDGHLLIARHVDAEKKIGNKNLYGNATFAKFAIDHLGYPYDNDEIARIIARVIGSKIGFKKGEIKRDKEYICSEYAYECFRTVGIKIKYNKLGFIAPVDFAKDDKINPLIALKVHS